MFSHLLVFSWKISSIKMILFQMIEREGSLSKNLAIISISWRRKCFIYDKNRRFLLNNREQAEFSSEYMVTEMYWSNSKHIAMASIKWHRSLFCLYEPAVPTYVIAMSTKVELLKHLVGWWVHYWWTEISNNVNVSVLSNHLPCSKQRLSVDKNSKTRVVFKISYNTYDIVYLWIWCL